MAGEGGGGDSRGGVPNITAHMAGSELTCITAVKSSPLSVIRTSHKACTCSSVHSTASYQQQRSGFRTRYEVRIRFRMRIWPLTVLASFMATACTGTSIPTATSTKSEEWTVLVFPKSTYNTCGRENHMVTYWYTKWKCIQELYCKVAWE